MKTEIGSVQNKSVSMAVLSGMVLYVLFVFTYVWFLPNYNLLKLGGRATTNCPVAFSVSIHHNHYNNSVNDGVWLEKISKTTPKTKRSAGFVILGVIVIFSMLFADKRTQQQLYIYRQNRGYALFAHRYAYLSLRTFRI